VVGIHSIDRARTIEVDAPRSVKGGGERARVPSERARVTGSAVWPRASEARLFSSPADIGDVSGGVGRRAPARDALGNARPRHASVHD